MKEFKVVEEQPLRIDIYIATKLEISRSLASQLISAGDVLVNNNQVKANYKVKTFDVITVTNQQRSQLEISPEKMDIDIVYEDDDVIIVNKESGIVVHPAAGSPTGTLVNGLMYLSKKLSSINGEYRPGVVHRIDKNTSGLLMFAKNDLAHDSLASQLQAKTTTREYIALVHGQIHEDKIIIDAPIGRDPKDRKRMTVTSKNSKEAITTVIVLERFEEYTLVKCILTTGRTHQIRCHMRYIEHPIVGDPEYGRRKSIDCDGQALHAKTLGFTHPTTNEYVEFDSELPLKMQKILNELRDVDGRN